MASVNPRRRTAPVQSMPGKDSCLPTEVSATLLKGATFHASRSLRSISSEGTFMPPTLSRAQSDFDEVLDANRRRIALTLSEVEEALSASTEALSLSPASPRKVSPPSTHRAVPQGFLVPPVVDPVMAEQQKQRRVLRPRSVRQTANDPSDSGIGSSISSVDGKATNSKESKTPTRASAISRSAALSTTQNLSMLSRKAIGRIHAHTLRPLLEKPSLKEFQPIVLDVPRRIRSKEIICLRDLEKTLIFMAPEKAKTAALYLDFCFTSIRCLQATVEYLSDHEQVRPGDRPYTNGYFIDLKEQIYHYGTQLAAVKAGDISGEEMEFDLSDEIKLYGGIAENGRPAELIRIRKDGTAVSMATGKPVDLDESPLKIKRSLSQQLEDEEEIMRSMARRKKNASPEELAPKRCHEPGCTKEFKRSCDLTKHIKTHSRPWKCPIPTCKYHEFGWPTEKEMDRHVNDKHSDAPAMYECLYTPCPYKSKRESNCKQHMEKAHGWQYVRTKTNGKKPSISDPISELHTPPLGNVSTPSTVDTMYGVPTPPQDQGHFFNEFPSYLGDQEWVTHNASAADMSIDQLLEDVSPTSTTSYGSMPPFHDDTEFLIEDEDIYVALMQQQMGDSGPLTPAHFYGQSAKMASAFPQTFQQPQPLPLPHGVPHHVVSNLPVMDQVHPAPHFSPSAEPNSMLYTPNSFQENHDSFESSGFEGDFSVFPDMIKGQEHLPLFGEVPSANLGLTQASQTELFNQIDWTTLNFPNLAE